MAVQIAKHYGANAIITTGRNQELLEKTKTFGASKTVSLTQDDEAIMVQLKEIHRHTPIDLVIDYLWGEPAELIFKALEGSGLNNTTHPIRIVSVGSMAGKTINLASEALRSSAIEIVGSGFGSLSKTDLERYDQEILPEMFQLAAAGKLTMELVVDTIGNIEQLWEQDIDSGKRLVISMG